jgi:hypothetical protein
LLQSLELGARHHMSHFLGSGPMRLDPRHKLLWRDGHTGPLLGSLIGGIVAAPRMPRVALCLELRAREMAGNPEHQYSGHAPLGLNESWQNLLQSPGIPLRARTLAASPELDRRLAIRPDDGTRFAVLICFNNGAGLA